MIIPLSEPFQYEDYKFSELNLDLAGKVTPVTMEMLFSKYRRTVLGKDKTLDDGMRALFHERPVLDTRFRWIVFEWLTDMPKEVVLNKDFSLDTYNAIMDAIAYFFMYWKEPSMDLPEHLMPETELEAETLSEASVE